MSHVDTWGKAFLEREQKGKYPQREAYVSGVFEKQQGGHVVCAQNTYTQLTCYHIIYNSL